MLFPSIASAQFFAKQTVLVWEVRDRNNDVELSRGTKDEIKAKLIDAFNRSNNHEAYSDIVSNIKNGLTSQSPIDITTRVREFYPQVKYVIFTTVKILERSNSYDKYKVLLESDMYSTETLKREKTAAEPMLSDNNQIPAACARLVSKLLGEQQSNQNNSNSYNNNNYSNNYNNNNYNNNYSNSSSSYSPPSYESADDLYKKGKNLYNNKNYTEAVTYFKRAAEQGHASSQDYLGDCYRYGRGVTKDYYEAVKWYEKAAVQGNKYSQYSLGECYYNGSGVTQDTSEAIKWYQKALDNGYTKAKQGLEALYFSGLSVVAIKNEEIDSDGTYHGPDWDYDYSSKYLYLNLGTFNRYDFGISVDFYPRPHNDRMYVLSLSTSYRVFNIKLENGIMYIETDNGDFIYNTGIEYTTNQWQTLNIRYSNGNVLINNENITNVIVDKSNGDNIISCINYSCGKVFNGRIKNLKIYN